MWTARHFRRERQRGIICFMTEQQRAALIMRVNSGSADALQCLIVEYHEMLRRSVERDVNPSLRRLLDPDDVLQQAYISAYRGFADCCFDGPGHFYNWLKKIAVNELATQARDLRRNKRDVRRQIAEGDTPLAGSPGHSSYPDLLARLSAGETTPSRCLGRQEAAATVLSCMARLSDDQRVVVRLRFLEDVPVAEIARRVGKTETAVYALCHRGLKSLRELLGSLTQYLTRL